MYKFELMDEKEMIQALENPAGGLPDSVFWFISSVTPMVNVDLLVQDECGRILLAWRKAAEGGGWHIPGGIVRFKETFAERIMATARKELHEEVSFEPCPIMTSEIFMEHQYRGHFISFLYQCSLPDNYRIDNSGKQESEDGFLKWHDKPVENLIQGQAVYKDLLNSLLVQI